MSILFRLLIKAHLVFYGLPWSNGLMGAIKCQFNFFCQLYWPLVKLPAIFSVEQSWVVNCGMRNAYHSDVIMSATASQITGISIVYSKVCSGADQRKHQSPASLAFVRGIHRWPVNSPHKGSVTRKMFPFDDVIMLTRWTPRFRFSLVCSSFMIWQCREMLRDPVSHLSHEAVTEAIN